MPSSRASRMRGESFSPSNIQDSNADQSGMVKPRMAAWPEGIMMAE